MSNKLPLAYSLQRGTSPVDWCEANYRFSPIIAEYYNTISSFFFVLLPLILIYLFKQYAKTVNRGIYIIWTLFAIVGFSSAYFHATLSLFGQLLDELSILWLAAAAFGMWVPRRHYPCWLNKDRQQFQLLVFIISFVGTMLAWVYPWINSFALMCLAVPIFYFLIEELKLYAESNSIIDCNFKFKSFKRCRNARVKRLGIRCAILWPFALTCWLSDRIFCDLWASLDFPYLHGAWHILVAITAYTICVLFAYFDANNEHPEKIPILKYWPSDNFELGVPYVSLKKQIDQIQ
ncbi:alkaline ceramidase 2-like protein [Dinothrombium tinctorium]|uniref:Alkaline ceramidase n=1 Tax=Dinothrombium tinctorium TaxID=1965070 RepID=A0A3S3P9Q0_9ACAR|nr:alkaline ceramidase 2-like protein [Dinothrombium tinctorium]